MDSREKNFKVGEIILFESQWGESGREENINDARRRAVDEMTGAQTTQGGKREPGHRFTYVGGSNGGSLWESSPDGFHFLRNTGSKAMGWEKGEGAGGLRTEEKEGSSPLGEQGSDDCRPGNIKWPLKVSSHHQVRVSSTVMSFSWRLKLCAPEKQVKSKQNRDLNSVLCTLVQQVHCAAFRISSVMTICFHCHNQQALLGTMVARHQIKI